MPDPTDTETLAEVLAAALLEHGWFDRYSAEDVAEEIAPLLAARIMQARAGEPWSACTGAGDCPEEWHEHGCYADKGQCSDPTDHHGYPEARAGEGALRERIERAQRLIDAWEHDAPDVVEPIFIGRLREVLRRDPAPVRLRAALAETDRP